MMIGEQWQYIVAFGVFVMAIAIVIVSVGCIVLTAISNVLCWISVWMDTFLANSARQHRLRRAKDRCLDVVLDILGFIGAGLFLLASAVGFLFGLFIVGPVLAVWFILTGKEVKSNNKSQQEK